MQVSTETKEGLNRVITVTVPAEDVKKAYAASFKKVAKNAKLDGFRKGHIPSDILESTFAHNIWTDAYDQLINDTIDKAIDESKLHVVGRPNVSISKASFKKDEDLVYTVAVEVMCDVALKPFEELKLKQLKAEVTDADVDHMVDTLREQQVKWQTEDGLAAEDGTTAKIDFLGRVDGKEFEGGKAKDFSLVIGKTQMIPGFTEQIKGHKAGDSFTISVKFPEEYHAKDLAGKDAEFDITVNAVQKAVLPEVDADFVKIYGVKDGSVETFKADLRRNMERELARALRNEIRDRLFKALSEQYGEFDIPSAFVQIEIERLRRNMMQQMSYYGMKKLPEAFAKDDFYKDEAAKDARLGVLLREIAEKAEIKEPSEASVNAELDLIAGAYEDPEQFKAELRKNKQQFANIQELAFERDLIDYVMSKAADGEEVASFDEIVNKRAAQH